MKKNLLKLLPAVSLLTFFPVVAFALNTQVGLGLVISRIQTILNSIIPVLVALGVVYFVWGVVQYMIGDGEEAKKKGKDRMIYGIIGFAVIISLWGLVNILVKTLGLSNTAPKLETITGTGTCGLPTSSSKLQDVLCYVTGIINNSIIPLIFAAATVMFVWGVVNFFILNADQQEKRAQGRQFMIWGIVALAVMLSVWGLVGILGSTFGVRGNILPQVTPPGSSPSGRGGNSSLCPDPTGVGPPVPCSELR